MGAKTASSWNPTTWVRKLNQGLKLKLGYFVDRHTNLCWAQIVTWAQYDEPWSSILGDLDSLPAAGRACRKQALEKGSCYCCKYKWKTFKDAGKSPRC